MRQILFACAAICIALLGNPPPSALAQEATPTSENGVVIIVPRLAISASPTPKPSATAVPTATATPVPTSRAPIREIVQFEAGQIPGDVNPLTGLRAEAETLFRRPLVVKVSNAPAGVRPQAGLGSADIVYEHTVETGLTRLSAIFYGEAPQRVGSVRSTRLIDTDIVLMYDALLAYSGGSQGVRDDLYWHIPYRRIFLDGAASQFMRDWDIPAPHNLFALPADIWDTAAELGEQAYPEGIDRSAFRTIPPEGAAEAASRVEVRHISLLAEWRYDEELRRYLRFTDGDSHGDSLTNEQLAVENVIVIFAYHELSDIIEDIWNDIVSYGHDISLMPAGELLLFRDGQLYSGRWLRSSAHEQLRFVDGQNQTLYLKPGKTWIHVVKNENQMRRDAEWVRWFAEGEG